MWRGALLALFVFSAVSIVAYSLLAVKVLDRVIEIQKILKPIQERKDL